MSKHTPGPWHTAGEQGVQIRSAKDQIAKVWTMRGNEWKANARLIAAAPELLELLREAAGYTRHPDYDWPVEFSRRVDAAFAKATGE